MDLIFEQLDTAADRCMEWPKKNADNWAIISGEGINDSKVAMEWEKEGSYG